MYILYMLYVYICTYRDVCISIYIYISTSLYLRWFASDTAHIVFIHITSAVKIVHIFMGGREFLKAVYLENEKNVKEKVFI